MGSLVRSSPVTAVYLLAVGATSTVLSLTNDRFDDRLLLALSTNLHQLARAPLRVLVASAFWLGDLSELWLWALLLVVILAPVERRLGSRRTVLAFALGHVGATLVVAAGLLVLVRLGDVSPVVEDARDVGASYGVLAVAALATYLLPRRLRLPYAVLLAGTLVVFAATSGTFTDFGHLTAAAIGLACYPLVRPCASGRTPGLPA
jgi:membrane associated rhomboid family serine protease